MKKFLVLMLALCMSLTLAACGSSTPAEDTATPAEDTATPSPAVETDDDWAYVQDKGTLVIGITEYDPMNYYDSTGKLVGFDTEFAEAVCAKLGVTPEFVIIDWDSKELELSSKNIDCIWNGLTVREELKASMDFSQSYLTNQQVVVIRAADAAVYTDLGTLARASVVAEEGSAGETAVLSSLTDSAYTPVSGQTDALLEVKSGTADIAVVDYTTANAMTGAGTSYSDLMILEGVALTDEEYAIGFRKDSNITEQVNTVIDTLMADGTLAAIAETYGLSDLLMAD